MPTILSLDTISTTYAGLNQFSLGG